MILVLGATGNIGREVVGQLTAAGAKVRAMTRTIGKGKELLPSGLELVEGHLEKPETLEPAMRGVEKMLLVSSADPGQVETQGNAIRAAKSAGVKHIVKISVAGANSSSPVALARWHAFTERQLAGSGIAHTILQPSFFMQNMLMNAPLIIEQGQFFGCAKDGKVSTVDVRDVAAVAAHALTDAGHEGKTYVVTGGEALSFSQMADKIGAATGRAVKYLDVPPPVLFKGLTTGAGLPDWLANDFVAMFVSFSEGKAAEVTHAVEEVTHHQPRTFDAFVRENAKTFGGK